MSKKCRAYSESKLGLEPADNRKAFYAGWDAAIKYVLTSDIPQEPVDETAKDRHEWVGLTDEEVDDIWNRYCDEMGEASINDAEDIARAIEAKLKEKNT
jgi:hypothetical protein